MLERKIAGLPVNHEGIDIPYSNLMEKGNETALCLVTRNLVADLWDHVKFLSRDHTEVLNDNRVEIRHHKGHETEEDFSVASGRLSPMEIHGLCCRRKTGAYLYVETLTVNRNVFGPQEWRYDVFLQYGIKTPDFPFHYDICWVGLSIEHALDFNKGILVTYRHSNLCYVVANLVINVLMSTHVRDDPLINPCCAMRSRKAFLDNSNPT